MDSEPSDLVRVARIGKPHGVRGAVTVQIFTDVPESRFASGNVLRVKGSAEPSREFDMLTVERSRWNKKILLLEFEEISDRSTAETLRNAELFAPTEDPLDGGEGWYAEELIGFSVHRGSFESTLIGKVSDLITGSVQDLLQVQLEDGSEVLIPFVEEIVPEIDEERGAVVITPPPGLLELNQD